MRWKCISSFHLRFHFPRISQNHKNTIKCFIQNILFGCTGGVKWGSVELVVTLETSCRWNRNGIRVISSPNWSKCRISFVCWALMMTFLFRLMQRTIRYQLRGRFRIAHSPSTPTWKWLHMIHKGNQRKIMHTSTPAHQRRRRRWKGIARGLVKKIKVVCKMYELKCVRVGNRVCNRIKQKKKKMCGNREKKRAKSANKEKYCCAAADAVVDAATTSRSLRSTYCHTVRLLLYIYFFYRFFSVSRIISHSARRGLVLCGALLFSNGSSLNNNNLPSSSARAHTN